MYRSKAATIGILLLFATAPIGASVADQLLEAAKWGNVKTITDLLQTGVGRAAVDSQNFGGQTPLHIAAERGHYDVVLQLLSVANIQAQDIRGKKPLHHTAIKGNTRVAQLLLERGAHVDAQDGSLGTPLHDAAGMGHTAITMLLLTHGACTNTRDKFDNTPLHRAIKHRHMYVAKQLVRYKADVDIGDKLGRTVLHIAACNGHTDTVNLLLDLGANAQQQEKSGKTPLLELLAELWDADTLAPEKAEQLKETAELLVLRGAQLDVLKTPEPPNQHEKAFLANLLKIHNTYRQEVSSTLIEQCGLPKDVCGIIIQCKNQVHINVMIA